MKALIKKILFILTMFILTSSYSQVDTIYIEDLKEDRRKHIVEGTYELSLGIVGVFVAISHITYTDNMSINDYVGLGLYGGSGIAFNIVAIRDFIEARKINKKIKELENEGTN